MNTKFNRLLSQAKELTSLDSDVYRKHLKGMGKQLKVLSKIEDASFSETALSQDDLTALEAIVMDYGRPVLLVENDKVSNSQSSVWQERLATHTDTITANIKRVGRVEVDGHPHQAFLEAGEEFFLGTCFVIGDNLLLTNRHVAIEFCELNGKIKSGMLPRVDFVEEAKRDTDNEIVITRAVEIGNDFDFAILEVQGGNIPSPVEFTASSRDLSADSDNPFVYIIGYPAFDTRNPTDLQNNIFDGKFNVKRLAPGRLRKIVGSPPYTNSTHVDRALVLDYTSLGGNSGSPVFDLNTGRLIGLHYAGRYAEANYAVPIWSILDRLNRFINRNKAERSEMMDNSYIESLLTERVMYMPFGKAKAIAVAGFNPRSANEVTNAAAAAIVLGFLGQQQFRQRLSTALSTVHPALSTAIAQAFGESERAYYPGWDDWSPTRPVPPWMPGPTIPQPPPGPLAYYMTEPVDGTCISGVAGGAGLGGLAGTAAGPVGTVIGIISGGLAGASAGGCFK